MIKSQKNVIPNNLTIFILKLGISKLEFKIQCSID